MSQDHQEKKASGVPRRDDVPVANEPVANDRREFIRQSLGVAPLMLTLGGRSYGGGTSMHGTLWSSLGTKWRHKGKWFEWKKRRWHWSKKSGDKYRDRDKRDHRDRNDDEWRAGDKTTPARKDWDWGKSDDSWRRELEADAKRRDEDWERRRAGDVDDDRDYDWRKDAEWRRSEGLSPFASTRSDRKKD